MSIGDQLNQIVANAQGALFRQSELAQLTYGSFDIAASTIQNLTDEEITVTYPVGLRADRQAIQGTRTYKKSDLLAQYQFLAFHQLAINGLFQLVAITEAMLSDVVRALIIRYPQKLEGKRQIPVQAILEAGSIEDVRIRAVDSVLNELSYKSPAEFSEALRGYLSLNLLECPAYHKYMEIKASRDIFIHNRGVANETYCRKAGTHARVSSGAFLPADTQYFLESFESCLQFNEWLEKELHDRWPSSQLEARLAAESSAAHGSSGAIS